MPKVLTDYIKHNGFDALANKLSIVSKRHTKYPNLVLLKYHMLESPMEHPVVQKCRGIILDEADNWRVVSYGYDKFFNQGGAHAAEIDWSTAKVFDKLDGSIMTLYHYDGEWQVASSGVPDATGQMMGSTITFHDLFWQVWNALNYHLPKDTDCCYMFELMTPYNRVVVEHKTSDIVLHGVRRLTDERELNPIVEGHLNNWHTVKVLSLESWDEVLAATTELDPMDAEGYVVCDANYNRQKVSLGR